MWAAYTAEILGKIMSSHVNGRHQFNSWACGSLFTKVRTFSSSRVMDGRLIDHIDTWIGLDLMDRLGPRSSN